MPEPDGCLSRNLRSEPYGRKGLCSGLRFRGLIGLDEMLEDLQGPEDVGFGERRREFAIPVLQGADEAGMIGQGPLHALRP